MTILLYFVLTASHTWQFMAIEHVESRGYCEMLAHDVNKAFANQRGNVKILCSHDDGIEV